MHETEHLKELEVLLKKAPFWKYATLATVCIEQEFEIYTVLAKNCCYDMTKFLKKVVSRFWQSIPTGYSIDDSFLLAIEESIFKPRDAWEEAALQIVKDMESTFYALWQKSNQDSLENVLRQLTLVRKLAGLCKLSNEETEQLLVCICVSQKKILEEIVAVPNKEKKTFLAEFQTGSREAIFDLTLLEKLRPARKEKPAKKNLPEIRHSSVDFDMYERKHTNHWLLNSTPEQWVTHYWDKTGPGTGGAFETNYEEKKLPELCRIMPTLYYGYAQIDYVENRMPERVRAFWYVDAYSRLCMYELVEKGYPIETNSIVLHDMEWFADNLIASAMICAYAAGAEDLIPRLSRFAKGVHKEQPYTNVQDYLEIFAGENSEELYHRVEQWERSDFREMILCILRDDAKEFRKALLHSVRHTRKMYDMGGCLFGPWSYACVKIAKKYGIEVEPVKVIELLDWNFDETPIDREKWRLPLQDEIDEWLNNN